MFKKLKEKLKKIYETEYTLIDIDVYIPLEYVILTIIVILWGLWILLK